jgi:hypothetical protein
MLPLAPVTFSMMMGCPSEGRMRSASTRTTCQVALDESEASGSLIDNSGAIAIRTVKLTVTMSPPEIIELSVTVPEEAGQTVKVSEPA